MKIFKKALGVVLAFLLAGLVLGILVGCSSGPDPATESASPTTAPPATRDTQDPSVAPEFTVQPSGATQFSDPDVRACVESAAGVSWQANGEVGHPSDYFDDPEIVQLCENMAAAELTPPPMDLDHGPQGLDPACLEENAKEMRELFPPSMTLEEIMADPLVEGACS